MSRTGRRSRGIVLVWLIARAGGFIAVPAAASPPGPAAGWTVSATPDGKILERVFDQAFGSRGGWSYTGAVAAVVQNGRVVFVKGFGHQDAAHVIPVDPARTRFQVGSITKTFTSIGVGRLMDRGLIASVDDPINRYLKRVRLPDNAGRALTIRMLGTHQAGFFEERREGWLRAGQVPLTADGAYLRSKMPAFLRPAETGSDYSNFGIGLLGLTLEDLTGVPYASFVQKEIFDPVGMPSALVVGAPRAFPEVAEAQAFYPDGTTTPIPQEWCLPPSDIPAGAIAASGADMARYMIALLGGSPETGIPALVSEKTSAVLMGRLGGTHPLVQGFGVVFMTNSWNGRTLVEHGGRLVGAFSYLILVPEARLGIFVSLTGEPGLANPLLSLSGIVPKSHPGLPASRPVKVPPLSSLRAAALEALFGKYRPPFMAGSALEFDPAEYTGEYIGGRRLQRPVTALFTQLFMSGSLTVAPDGPGGLRIGKFKGFKPVAKDVFWSDPALDPDRPSGWNDLFVFRRDPSGRVADGAYLYTDNVYDKVPDWKSPGRMSSLLLACAAVLLTGLLSPLWARKNRGRRIAPLTALGLVLLPAAFFAAWPRMPVESLSYVSIRPGGLIPFQVLADLVAVLAAALIVSALRPVRKTADHGFRAALGRWHLRLLALAAGPLLWSFWHLYLIGWNIH
jgi:CubicO group peptidase (beta-lactamase class C family)